MAARTLAAAFLLSLLVPLCEALVPGLARGSLAALAILPWLVLGPLPCGRAQARAPDWREPLLLGSLALPPLCLGAGVDLARGAEPRGLMALSVAAWTVLVLWSWAAARATGSTRARAVYAPLWFVLLPGLAAVRVALAWVPLRADAGLVSRAPLFALDPLVWCHRWGRAGGLEEPAFLELGLAVCAALLVLLLVSLVDGRSEERA